MEDKRNGRTWDVDPWLTPEEALGEDIQAEFIGGRGDLVRQALAHVGWGR